MVRVQYGTQVSSRAVKLHYGSAALRWSVICTAATTIRTLLTVYVVTVSEYTVYMMIVYVVDSRDFLASDVYQQCLPYICMLLCQSLYLVRQLLYL